MKKIKQTNRVCGQSELKYRAKMYKSGKQWIVKGLLFTGLLIGGLAVTDTAFAAEWTANSVESIKEKLTENQSSYTFEEGDTFYNISLAINVRWEKLMELNGFSQGSQYNVPVGTTISFDGSRVTIANQEGKIVNQEQLKPEDKVDPKRTFGNQVYDAMVGIEQKEPNKSSNKVITSTNDTTVSDSPKQKLTGENDITDLMKAKNNAKNEIQNNNNLSEEEKNKYLQKIDQSESLAAIRRIFDIVNNTDTTKSADTTKPADPVDTTKPAD
ncbi:LysM peptidoglycan-binding domain-containing protein, partial [Listeria monocytogenes]|nr:LysM peptidoglycan-binding domain-containing protein [Listeria monocytogenes]